MPHQTIAFPGEARSYFKDWLVVCQKTPHSPDNPGICHSNVSVKDKKLFPYSDGTIFQLTLQRTVNSNHHIEFYHTLECRCPSSEVCLQVDNHPKTTFMVQAEGNLAKLWFIFHVVAATPCVKVKVASVLSCQLAVNVAPLS